MTHHCHAIGCEIAVPPEMLMCKPHWFLVPGYIRTQVWSHYRRGQCDDMSPSGSWMIAATRAICAVAVKEGVLTPDQATARIAREIELVTSRRVRTSLVNIQSHRGQYVYIGRGSPYGNPFSHLADSKHNVIRVPTREAAINAYRSWINGDEEIPGWPKPTHEQIMALRGKVLGCFCDPLPCHGEFLIDYIEAEQEAPSSVVDVSGVSPTDQSPSDASSSSEDPKGSGGGTDLRQGVVSIDGEESGRSPASLTRSKAEHPPKEAAGEKGHQAEAGGSVPLTSTLSPFLRWPGGKAWLVDKLVPRILACKPTMYVEPFLGAGAIALALPATLPKVLSDYSAPLINAWQWIQKAPRSVGTFARMITTNCGNNREGYLLAREHFNGIRYEEDALSGLERAGLMLYLNACSFNGVWRENKHGKYNVPFGDVKTPAICTDEELVQLSAFLTRALISQMDCNRVIEQMTDYMRGVNEAGMEDVIALYADPPYYGGFDDYLAGGFTEAQHEMLSDHLRAAAEQGIKVFATNSDTEFIRKIYDWAFIEPIEEARNVAQKVKSRKAVPCLLIRGHEEI